MRLPSSPTRTNSVARPSVETSFSRNQAPKPNALPDFRLQARQWHTAMRKGSPEHVAESWPHEHSGRRVVIVGSYTSAPMRRAWDRFIFTITSEVGGDAIDEIDSRRAALFRNLDNGTSSISANFRDRFACLSRAMQLGLRQLRQMLEILLSQMRATAICRCRYVLG